MRIWSGMTDQHTSVPQDDGDDPDDGFVLAGNMRLTYLGVVDRRKGFTPCTPTGSFQSAQYSLPVVGVGAILATSAGTLITVPL